MDDLKDILPVLIPIGIVHVVLMGWALLDIFHRKDAVAFVKLVWGLVVAAVVVTGPLVYFMYGRGDRSWARRVAAYQERMRQESMGPQDSKKDDE
jgi:hypothetical protein